MNFVPNNVSGFDFHSRSPSTPHSQGEAFGHPLFESIVVRQSETRDDSRCATGRESGLRWLTVVLTGMGRDGVAPRCARVKGGDRESGVCNGEEGRVEKAKAR
ncbi:unnamed protein product [Sphenostylis stenocarpa]|uniref:Uncharacterized protein n=1 Tax=Sphenostylis stenocarpa TaxID=92480 RepID=A0AA86SPY5_9FABA|nr:unnamed protein product [Sphenostylis stenocarpa]